MISLLFRPRQTATGLRVEAISNAFFALDSPRFAPVKVSFPALAGKDSIIE